MEFTIEASCAPNSKLLSEYPFACPEEGSFIGFKCCQRKLIVKLEIPADALRCSATGIKCRCSKAKVLSITNLDGSPADVDLAVSKYDSNFIYLIGETVEELINKAVEKAVQDEAARAVNKATNETILTLKREIHSEVQKVIDKEYESVKDSVLKEITASAAKIDSARVRRDVESAAKEAVLEKFDDNLDDILEKFNENLDNTAKIYSSIRETLTQTLKSGKEYIIRVD